MKADGWFPRQACDRRMGSTTHTVHDKIRARHCGGFSCHENLKHHLELLDDHPPSRSPRDPTRAQSSVLPRAPRPGPEFPQSHPTALAAACRPEPDPHTMDNLSDFDLEKLNEKDKTELRQFLANETQKARVQSSRFLPPRPRVESKE